VADVPGGRDEVDWWSAVGTGAGDEFAHAASPNPMKAASAHMTMIFFPFTGLFPLLLCHLLAGHVY